METKEDVKCLHCARCCHWLNPDNQQIDKCKFLIKTGKKYWCRIYPNRIGLTLKKYSNSVAICKYRKDANNNYKNCPNNELAPEKPMLEVGY